MIEISVTLDFKIPKVVTQNDIDFVYQFLADDFLSVSHFFSKKYYPSKKGYYVFGKTKLKVRTLKDRAGFVTKKLMRISLDETSPYSVAIREVVPSFEGFVLANEQFGEENYENLLSYLENYYFDKAHQLYGSNYEKKFIPVISKYREEIYHIQLFGDPKVIELFNVLGLDFFGKKKFFYHAQDLPRLKELLNRVKKIEEEPLMF